MPINEKVIKEIKTTLHSPYTMNTQLTFFINYLNYIITYFNKIRSIFTLNLYVFIFVTLSLNRSTLVI